MAHAQWALTLVRREIEVFIRRQEAGDIGEGDHIRRKKVLGAMKYYLLNKDAGKIKGYGTTQAMMNDLIIPHSWITARLSNQTAFTSHRLGQSEALKQTLRDLVDNGTIMEVPKIRCVENYGFHGKCYGLLRLDN